MSPRDELEDINISLRILDELINDLRAEEMKLRIRSYDSISQEEQLVVTREEFSLLKENTLLSWRQRQIDSGYINEIENSIKYLMRDLLLFIERYPLYNADEHFRDIIQYLYRKYLTNVSRERKKDFGLTSFNNTNSYEWPLPLEHNIRVFRDYLDGLIRTLRYEGTNVGQGKCRKSKNKKKRSLRKHKHKKVKSCKSRSH